MKKRTLNNNLFLITVCIISFLILLGYSIPLVVPVISDETITMANAAWLSGYNWEWMISSLGGTYYRFGQALLSLPLFAVFDDPGTIYSVSIVLQSFLQVSLIPVIYTICKRHLAVNSQKLSVLLGVSVCFIPSMVLYTFYYRGDFLLGVLPWYVLLCFLEAVKAVENKCCVRRILFTFLAVFFSVFSYTAHMRGIIVIIALFFTVLFFLLFEKKKSLHLGIFFAATIIFFLIDFRIGNILKSALYSISGLHANAIESIDVGAYFDLFSYNAIKDLLMLCLSWIQTLILSTQGLVLIGVVACLMAIIKTYIFKKIYLTANEKCIIIFSVFIFAGYFAIGALYFRGTYIALSTGILERRVDRLLYDRYAICGSGMMVFLALYILCCKKEWFGLKEKLLCVLAVTVTSIIWLWKILPIAIKYSGYIYNAIILNTFNTVSDPSKILSGDFFSKGALLGISLFSGCFILVIFYISHLNNKNSSYKIITIVLIADLFLIHINYIKIRKPSNDFVVEATREVVNFMKEFDEEISNSYPYILKGSLSGVRIQFYQSQLMNYKMFGKKDEKQLGVENYFIISECGDIDLTWYEDDYYLFEDFDYDNAMYDVVYIKGEALMQALESIGYEMIKYVPDKD